MLALAIAALVAGPASAQVATGKMGALRPDQKQFLELYKELVETDTSVTSIPNADNGGCTQAAAQIAARLKKAGFSDEQITLFSVPEHPKEGGIVAVYPGTSKTRKPILLLAHIDVVAAKRADWVRDPFKLVEENGYYYARGIADDKHMPPLLGGLPVRRTGRAKIDRVCIKKLIDAKSIAAEAAPAGSTRQAPPGIRHIAVRGWPSWRRTLAHDRIPTLIARALRRRGVAPCR